MLLDVFHDLTDQELVEFMNSLSSKQLVDFVQVGDTLVFKARDQAEVSKTKDLDANERLIYNIIRGVASAGKF